jgi:hypothetical protein
MGLLRGLALGTGLLAAALVLVFVWLAVGVHLAGPGLRLAQAGVLLACSAVLWGGLVRRPAVPWALALAGTAAMAVWWSQLPPRADRVWAPEYARTLAARIDGDLVTLENVRNFRWQTIATAEESWETRVLDASRVSSVDVITSVWGNPLIAHTMVSFGFADGQHVVFSAETRRREGQVYSTLGGFVREFELALLAADERDVIWLRTDLRGERVSLFPLTLSPEARRALFLAFAGFADELERSPRWYNTLLDNCTTVPVRIVRSLDAAIPLDWRILASGKLPGWLFDRGVLPPGLTLADIEARAALAPFGPWPEDGAAYSRAIRSGWQN